MGERRPGGGGGGTGAERNTPIKEVSMGIYARVNSRHRVHRCSAVTRAAARVAAAAAASAPLRYSPLLSFNGGAITSGLPSDAIINRRTIMTARREAPGRAITLIVIFERAFPLSCTGKLPPAEMSAEHERGKHEYIPSQGQHSRSRARSMSSGSSIRFGQRRTSGRSSAARLARGSKVPRRL